MLKETPEIVGDSTKVDKKEELETQVKFSGLVSTVREYFQTSLTEREATERRWLSAYRNYRGEYDEEVLANIDSDKSHLFVKITKTKVLAAYGQILEVLFSTNRFPIGVMPTEVPEGISEYAHVNPTAPEPELPQSAIDRYGFEGDGREIKPGMTADTVELGELQEKYGVLKLQKGPSPDNKQMPQIAPAKEAAENMERRIHDQLDSTNASSHLRSIAFEMCLLGTGILEGPFSTNKVVHNWKRDEKKKVVYDPINKIAPVLRAVSLWDFFHDPGATSMIDCEWTIVRHKLTRSQLRDLMKQPLFNEEAIKSALNDGPNYEVKYFEPYLKDGETQQGAEDRFEVLSFWGMMDAYFAEEAGLEFDKDLETEMSQVPINVWICGPHILRLLKNPFVPARLPYLVCPYETHPYQLFGIGVAENMEDSQQAMNGLARQTIDNINLSGNIVFDIDESALVSGQDYHIYPGKIFRRQSGLPGQAVYTHKFPNVTNETMIVFDKFRQLADEQTGIPSYTHGQTGISGTTRTASGMSMLFGAAALNIKTVIKNIDDYMLKPLGEAMFAWNMQFNEDENLPIRGDLEVRAKGTAALMQKEVRSQRIMTLMQVGSNPYAAPHIKWPYLIKEVAKTLDIPPEEIINDPETAAIYAQLIGGFAPNTGATGLQQPQGAGGEQAGMGGPSGVSQGPNELDATGRGGGNIGTGDVQMPGQTSFSAASPRPA